MGKSSQGQISVRDPNDGKSPEIKFDFEHLNPKRPQWAPKMGKSPGVKFEFGDSPKGKMPPE
jgi:hypothetical protein